MNRKFTEQELVRRHKLDDLKKQGIKPYSERIDFSHYSDQVKNELAHFTKEQAHDKKIKMSAIGRIMTKRGPFIVIKDAKGLLQGYFNNKEDQKLADFIDFLDLGDIVWISGYGMKTNTNEATIHIEKVKLLSKSLRPLPEKYHSITDKEEKQRRRYVDLIMNDDTRARFWVRTKIIKSIRKFFDDLGYMEADTPILHSILGGAAALPFITKHNALNMNFYLRIATELPLKRLIVGGMERVYEIGRLFRNEGVDSTHNPEFTTIEFYEANSDLQGMMSRTEDLLNFVANELGVKEVEYNNHKISFKKPFKRITMREAIKEKIGVDFYKVKTLEEAKEIADKHDVHYEKFHKVGHIVSEFFAKFVEDDLIQPTFVTEFPIEISPLAKKIENDPEYTDRSELFIVGKEYANMFTELNDPIDQYERFESQIEERKNGNKEANEMDLDFVEALEYGLPPTGGCGVGIDRLVMLLTKSYNITDVILFPHLKHKGND